MRRSLPVTPQLLSVFVVEFRAATPRRLRNFGAFRHLEWFGLVPAIRSRPVLVSTGPLCTHDAVPGLGIGQNTAAQSSYFSFLLTSQLASPRRWPLPLLLSGFPVLHWPKLGGRCTTEVLFNVHSDSFSLKT